MIGAALTRSEALFLSLTLAFAVLFGAVTLREYRQLSTPAISSVTAKDASGKPRDADLVRLTDLIREKRLSDHEARHYRAADDATESTLDLSRKKP